jgi:hypothetical protein
MPGARPSRSRPRALHVRRGADPRAEAESGRSIQTL